MRNTFNSGYSVQNLSIFILRSAIGWHFLYEGFFKILTPGWSSASFLTNSGWFLSSILNWIPTNSLAINLVDFLNVYGLILIGLGLMLGIFVRVASLSGALLLMLYYIANPPFLTYGRSFEGSYMFVDKNFVEMCALFLLAFARGRATFGLGEFFVLINKINWGNRNHKNSPLENSKTCNSSAVSRRQIIERLVVLPLFGIFVFALFKKYGYQGIEDSILAKNKNTAFDAKTGATSQYKITTIKDLKVGEMPVGIIGEKKMSRLIFGGNLINGQAHARDLNYVSPLIESYFSDEKIIQCWSICEQCGIDTMSSWPSAKFMRVYKEYKRRGGKIQWLGHVGIKDLVSIKTCIEYGAIGLYIAGDVVEQSLHNKELDKIAEAVSFTKQNGLFAGVACHTIRVPKTFEEQKIDVDFYMKTLHHDNYWSATPKENRLFDIRFGGEPQYNAKDKSTWYYNDNMWCIDVDETIEFMKNINKPWIGFKVLAAGAISIEDGFKYAFESGSDFIHVGIFDFQIVQDVNCMLDIFSGKINRERAWMA